jgi:hypothetical protein
MPVGMETFPFVLGPMFSLRHIRSLVLSVLIFHPVAFISFHSFLLLYSLIFIFSLASLHAFNTRLQCSLFRYSANVPFRLRGDMIIEAQGEGITRR